jgi:hypothetical protein
MRMRISTLSLGLLFTANYTEPGRVAHFAETKADPVVVYITGHGPTDTAYVK